MTDPIPLNGRLTEILRGLPSPIAAEAFEPGYYRSCVTWEELVEKLAPIVAQAAEEHYRPRIETVEQLDALPDLSIVGLRMTSDEAPDGALFAIQKDGDWFPIGDERTLPMDKMAEVIAQGGSVLLWSPGAGE